MTDDGPDAPPEDRDLKVDAWLVKAAREYRSGWVDQPLWAQVLAESGNDEEQAKAAYLRARARLLHEARRDRRSRRSAQGVKPAAQSSAETAPAETRRSRRKRANPTLRILPYAATVCGLIAMIAGVSVVVVNQQDATVAKPQTASPIPRPRVASPAQSTKSPTASAKASPAAHAEDAQEPFAEKIARLIEAKNWNMAVIYATEWTRKEPANVNSWIQLSNGYTALGQFADALDAAAKATELAPDDPRVWRNLGSVNVALDRAEEALHAFEHAVTLDGRDVTSLVQVGRLNAQLARLPQAKAAFDKALDANPDEAGALCGQMLVARQEGRAKDADAIASKVQSLGRPCLNEHENAFVPVVAKTSTSQKPPPRTR